MRGKAHDLRTRAMVLAGFLTGETVPGAARLGGVSRATAREWWRAFQNSEMYHDICEGMQQRLRNGSPPKKESDEPMHS